MAVQDLVNVLIRYSWQGFDALSLSLSLKPGLYLSHVEFHRSLLRPLHPIFMQLLPPPSQLFLLFTVVAGWSLRLLCAGRREKSFQTSNAIKIQPYSDCFWMSASCDLHLLQRLKNSIKNHKMSFQSTSNINSKVFPIGSKIIFFL